MRHLLLPLFMAATLYCSAQDHAVLEDSITRAIDAEVWRPFVKAFNARNAEAYLAVHAKNVVRWPLGWGEPQMGDSMHAQTRRGWTGASLKNEDRTIELFFTHRSHTDSFAFDIGYYQLHVVPNEGQVTTHVGHFTTILGREDGRWKIFLDADNGDGVTRQDVKKGVPLKPD